ncbi:AraC family transcriptional regulator [Peptoniphilus equinus]|uniref:AraC family transcriptional regulator n=1 Tax=Peptoniphilus equinus TaxID=3016343 RepID=A0ABY7QRY5_9FIRM|nr:helix-turn-helix domain-containing protein [Peptoniphilus equinus]WBW49527.1 AraC family transcriptional regulator [Peptoniphilus equinus]
MRNVDTSVEAIGTSESHYVLTHWHDAIELVLILEGDVNCLINGQTLDLHEGDVCIINRNQLHRMFCNEGDSGKFLSVELNKKLFTSEPAIRQKYIDPLYGDGNFACRVIPAQSICAKELAKLMRSVGELQRERPEGYELRLVAYLHLIWQKLYLLYAQEHNIETHVSEDMMLYRKMVNFIYKHYGEKLYVTDIAGVANISRSKSYAIFKKYTLQTPMEFLNLYRLERSAAMLRETDEAIATVAQKCGFGQQSYFGNLFYQQYCMTPKTYREASRDDAPQPSM